MTKLFFTAAALAAMGGLAHADGPRTLTFEDAIAVATANSPDVAIAAEGAASAAARVEGAKARRLPGAHVDANVHRYSKGFSIMFGTMSVPFYEDLTTNSSIAVTQPLTGLVYL